MKKIILTVLISSMSFSVSFTQSNEDLLNELMNMSGDNDIENVDLDDLDELNELNELLNQQQQRQPSTQTNQSTEETNDLEAIQQRTQQRTQQNRTTNSESESASDVLSSEIPEDALGDLEAYRETFSNNNSTFLRFVPVDTNIVFNQSLIIPPTREFYVYSFGRSLLPEDIDRDSYSVCYIQFRPSDRARSLQRNRAFPIIQNDTHKVNVRSEPDRPVYVSTFRLDTPHIEKLKCMTNQKEEPLTIRDFNRHFNNFVSLRFPSYEEI